MSDILSKLLLQNYTLHQLRNRLVVLKNYLSNTLFHSRFPQPGPQDTKWLTSLPPDLYQKFTKLNLDKRIAELEKEVERLPLLIIYLPFPFPEEEQDRLGIWLRQNISPEAVFDIKFDPDLISGCALSWKGIYRDYSVRASIEKNKEAILRSFKSI